MAKMPRNEAPPENVESTPEGRASGFFSRSKIGKVLKWVLLIGGGAALARHLGVFRNIPGKAGEVADTAAGYAAKPFEYLGDKAKDAVLGKMENPATDNGAQKFYRGVDKFIRQDIKGTLDFSGAEHLNVPPREKK